MKVSFVISGLLLVCLILGSALLDVAHAASYSNSPLPSPQSPPPGPSLCGEKCEKRCGRNWRKSFCVKLCIICCGKCGCVPSGPFADKGECPCYRDLKNDRGKSKCP